MSVTVAGRLRECKNTEFVLEFNKTGFDKVTLSRAVRLRECQFMELRLCITFCYPRRSAVKQLVYIEKLKRKNLVYQSVEVKKKIINNIAFLCLRRIQIQKMHSETADHCQLFLLLCCKPQENLPHIFQQNRLL